MPEPWMVSEDFVSTQGDTVIAHCHTVDRYNLDGKENARRIVACVNACVGIPTENLEEKTVVVSHDYNLANIKQQRDELLAALKKIESETAATWVCDVARAAIFKAEATS